ncbi:carboxymuconolactone decarboxylase family protein [Paenibacillus sp. GD4]|uniref:carboxymuconolactone decarboxylase family protein n=1 Tax=Paenibacillus sp. GD4 TaxID=3068890 RepID=UPI002796CCCD|nr:carboxymuconolactone decarboxylase family protein [Paenibacillus sp. GD4]MDQ1911429.1 carboxymuconolactone decarboxylase family protein [Paenibacillus sp. GD4]
MKTRMNYRQANPAVFDMMLQLETTVQSLGIDKTLYKLIKIRASQLNGCAFCIDMHAKELHSAGEQLERILLLTAWREVPIYSDKERAALELTEYLTRLSESGFPEEVYERVRAQFSEAEIAALIMAVNVINGWNRLGVATGMYPGCFL